MSKKFEVQKFITVKNYIQTCKNPRMMNDNLTNPIKTEYQIFLDQKVKTPASAIDNPKQLQNYKIVSKSDLIGQYLGQESTEKHTIEYGIGQHLIIDEIFVLDDSYRCDSFSKKVIDILNSYLTNNKISQFGNYRYPSN